MKPEKILLIRWLMVGFLVGVSTGLWSEPLWYDRPIALKRLALENQEESVAPAYFRAQHQRFLQLDWTRLQQQLQPFLTDKSAEIALDIPMPDGRLVPYQLRWAPVIAGDFYQRHPDYMSLYAEDSLNPLNRGYFTVSRFGLRGMISHAGQWVFIDPPTSEDSLTYSSYYAKDAQPLTSRPQDIFLSREPESASFSVLNNRLARPATVASDTAQSLRTYRLALTASQGYVDFHGGPTQAMNEILVLVARLNAIYQRDLGIRFELVARQEDLVGTILDGTTPGDFLDSNQKHLDALLGSENYDIGHFVDRGRGGLATTGVCDDEFKAQAYTATPKPTGDAFYIDYVAHEIGHQFSATHTFNGRTQSCANDSRVAESAVEPGSGSTIMGYAGICGDEDLQSQSDAYFHALSIAQISHYITQGRGSECGITVQSLERPLKPDAGQDFSIPAYTAFRLQGDIKTDATLAFTWEQMDIGDATTMATLDEDDRHRPLFRSWPPTDRPVRYLPRLADLMSTSTTLGEAYATTTRELNFRLTARYATNTPSSTLAGTHYDDVKVNVVGHAGPFQLTWPNQSQRWAAGETRQICWDVSNTDLAPINCAQVDVILQQATETESIAGQILEQNTPNDGETWVRLPTDLAASVNSRLILQCSNGQFFHVSHQAIAIVDSTDSTTANIEHNCIQNIPLGPTLPDIDASSTLSTASPRSGGIGASPAGLFWWILIVICLKISPLRLNLILKRN